PTRTAWCARRRSRSVAGGTVAVRRQTDAAAPRRRLAWVAVTNDLQLHSISRAFGDRQVLKEVSFTVAAGRLTGFVGGNGAGKTTTMRIILGVLAADSGQVTWRGAPLTR